MARPPRLVILDDYHNLRALGTPDLALRHDRFNSSVIQLLYCRRMDQLLPFAVPALILVNLWTILRFWQDKQRAVAGVRRIPESDLLGLALIGGSPGAFLARNLFRHKTRKEPFSTQLMVIAVIQIGALIGFAIL